MLVVESSTKRKCRCFKLSRLDIECRQDIQYGLISRARDENGAAMFGLNLCFNFRSADKGITREIAAVRREIATKPSGTTGVTRWRSDNALNQEETGFDTRQDGTLQIRTSSQSRTTINRYCPVCRKSRTNTRMTGASTGGADKAIDRETSSDGRSAELHRRFAQINDDLFKLSQENRRLNEELHKLKAEKSELESQYANVKHSVDRDRHSVQQENENLREQLNSKETNLLRCESQLTKVVGEKRQLDGDMQKLRDRNDELAKEISSIRADLASRPGGVVRWRSDNALNHETDSESEARQRRTSAVAQIRANTRSVSPTKNRTSSTLNRYCPVCKKFRHRNYICTNVATAASLIDTSDFSRPSRVVAERDYYKTQLETLRGRQNRLIDTTCDSGFTDGGDSSPERRIDVRRRLASLNSDLMKLGEENRRLNDELHKLRVEKAVCDTEKSSLKRLLDQQRDELRQVRQENADLRSVKMTPRPTSSVATTKIVQTTTTTDKARHERILRDNDDLRSEIAALKTRLDSEKARYDSNTSLVNAHKTKLEQDNISLRSNNETLSKNNELLQNQLHAMDDRVKDVQRMLVDAKVSSKEADGKERTLAYVNELQNSISELMAKFRQSELSRSTVERKLAEINKLADDATAENSRLRSKLTSAEQNIIRLEGDTGAQNVRSVELEKQLMNKDRDISRLKGIIRDLEQEYEKFRKSLSEQEGNLLRLQRDLTVTGGLKEQAEKSRESMLDDYKRLQDQLQQMTADNLALQRELEMSLEEQEKLKRTAQRHLNDVRTYEKLLNEKDKERVDLVNRYQDTTTEIRRMEAQHTSTESQASLEQQHQRYELNQARDQIANLKSQNEKLIREQNLLKDQLRKCESSLDQLQNALEGARNQNDSLQSDLASLRQLAIGMDSVKLQLVQELSEKDCELQKAQRCIDDLTLEVELIRTQVTKEQLTTNRIDEALREARDTQLKAQVDAQQKTEETRYMRERIAEYELKLELQGRDLNNLRAKLTRAEGEIQQLRRQLVEEQSS